MRTFVKPDYENSYDFYVCNKCGRLITHPESCLNMSKGKGCVCGGLKLSPTNITWKDYFRPRVLWFWYLRGKGLA